MVSCNACGLSHNAKESGVTFHRFPRNPVQREKWINFAKTENKIITRFAVLCSLHFEDSDFEKPTFKVRLNKNAVPTIVADRQKYTRAGTLFKTEPCLPTLQPSIEIEPSRSSIPCTAENVDSTTHVFEEDEPTEKKLKHTVQMLSTKNLKQSDAIRKLHKKVWAQQQQILKLKTLIRELEQNDEFANHVSSIKSSGIKSLIGELEQNDESANHVSGIKSEFKLLRFEIGQRNSS